MEASDIKRLKGLESENQRLMQIFADLRLEHWILKDIVEKRSETGSPQGARRLCDGDAWRESAPRLSGCWYQSIRLSASIGQAAGRSSHCGTTGCCGALPGLRLQQAVQSAAVTKSPLESQASLSRVLLAESQEASTW